MTSSHSRKTYTEDFKKEVVEIGGLMLTNVNHDNDYNVPWEEVRIIDTAEDYQKNILKNYVINIQV